MYCEDCPYRVCDHEEFWGAIVERYSCGTEDGSCAYKDEEEEEEVKE